MESTLNENLVEVPSRPKWRQVALFIGMTFGLTWALNLFIWLSGGLTGNPSIMLLLQLQMLLPAFSAIVLGLFVFSDSPIHWRADLGAPRWFFLYFLFYTAVYILLSILSSFNAIAYVAAASISQAVTFLGLLLLVVLRFVGGREAFARAGLAGGKLIYWLLFTLLLMALYGIQTFLNYLFNLGQSIDLVEFLKSVAPGSPQVSALVELPRPALWLIMGAQTALLAPIIALLITFGEEYGWRGYLQGELIKLGRLPGVVLVGVIWGLWHAPIILMGYNYPSAPAAGVFVMIAYCIGLGFILSYAVFKSGSVWLAAFLHGVNNQFLSFLMAMVYRPHDNMWSFGIGLYGMPLLAIVAGLLLLDPIWRRPATGRSSHE